MFGALQKSGDDLRLTGCTLRAPAPRRDLGAASPAQVPLRCIRSQTSRFAPARRNGETVLIVGQPGWQHVVNESDVLGAARNDAVSLKGPLALDHLPPVAFEVGYHAAESAA